MELIFVWLSGMENLHIAVLHSYSKPVSSWTPAQTEDLAAEVMLLELSSLPEVPGPDSVVQSSSPELGTISRNINTAGSVSVTLELSDQGLVVKVPHCNVPVTETKFSLAATNISHHQYHLPAAAETHFRVRADGQSVAGWSRTRQLRLDPGLRGGQVPDRQGARLSSNYQSSSIRQQLDRSDVVLPLQTVQLGHGLLSPGLSNVPDLDAAFATSVDILGGVGHGDSAHHLSVWQRVNLPTLPGDTRRGQSVLWEADWLQVAVLTHVERVAWLTGRSIDTVRDSIG